MNNRLVSNLLFIAGGCKNTRCRECDYLEYADCDTFCRGSEIILKGKSVTEVEFEDVRILAKKELKEVLKES